MVNLKINPRDAFKKYFIIVASDLQSSIKHSKTKFHEFSPST